MADYISREAVLALGYWHGEHPDFDHPNPDGVDAVDVSDVEAIPAADAIEVVRCKDCIYWDDDPDTYGADDGPKGKCMKSFEMMYADDFCSYGKRRNE